MKITTYLPVIVKWAVLAYLAFVFYSWGKKWYLEHKKELKKLTGGEKK
jgi:hypothetical protein